MQTNSDYATNLQTYKDFTGLGNIYGQIIETWQDLTPKGSWGKEMPLLQWYIGWCSIIIGGRYIISVSFNFFMTETFAVFSSQRWSECRRRIKSAGESEKTKDGPRQSAGA